jgi:hypothetical protein
MRPTERRMRAPTAEVSAPLYWRNAGAMTYLADVDGRIAGVLYFDVGVLAGNVDDAAPFRQAFLLRRGAVESVFSVLGYFGLGDKAQRRMKWGGDLEMEWVLALACLFMTGRRLAHETGLYTLAYEQAIAAGLLKRPKWGTESPWPAEPLEGEDERASPFPRRALLDQGDFEFELMVDMQDILDSDRTQSPSDDWDDVGEPSIADDEVIPVNADGIDENAGLTSPRDWTERSLDIPELDEAEYVKRFRDVDIDRLISDFDLSVEKDFGIKNEYAAVRQIDDLGLTEDLNNPLVLDAGDDEVPTTSVEPDEDMTDDGD